MKMSVLKPMRVAQVLLAALFLGAGTGTVAVAHHSFAAQYDSNKPLKVAGVVTKVEWTNPHVYIYVDVADPKTKKITNWGFEMGPPHMLQKAGWKRNSLTIGEAVSVEGWQARDASNHANARRVTRTATGEVLGAATSNSQTLAAAPGTRPAQK
jgi:hypothetical protein